MAQRPAHIWTPEAVAQLYHDLDDALRRYEAYCHEAADRAPRHWRQFWRDEAASLSRTRSHMLRRATEWIEYAALKRVEVLGSLEGHGEATEQQGASANLDR